jgi:hypothetical protein
VTEVTGWPNDQPTRRPSLKLVIRRWGGGGGKDSFTTDATKAKNLAEKANFIETFLKFHYFRLNNLFNKFKKTKNKLNFDCENPFI